MKLLTKLGALGSCWQSPPHHHLHSDFVSGFEQENVTTSLNPHPKRRSSSAHWRPALTAISEDNSAAAVDDVERRKKDRRARPAPCKAVRANRVKPSFSSSDIDSSWKVQAQIAIPAFAPAPFMF